MFRWDLYIFYNTQKESILKEQFNLTFCSCIKFSLQQKHLSTQKFSYVKYETFELRMFITFHFIYTFVVVTILNTSTYVQYIYQRHTPTYVTNFTTISISSSNTFYNFHNFYINLRYLAIRDWRYVKLSTTSFWQIHETREY